MRGKAEDFAGGEFGYAGVGGGGGGGGGGMVVRGFVVATIGGSGGGERGECHFDVCVAKTEAVVAAAEGEREDDECCGPGIECAVGDICDHSSDAGVGE